MHEHRAFGVADAVLADGADQHADELAVSAAPDDEQVRALRGFDQDGRWVPVDHPGVDAYTGWSARTVAIGRLERLRTSSSGSKSSGTGMAQPKLDGHSHVMHDFEHAAGQIGLAGRPRERLQR